MSSEEKQEPVVHPAIIKILSDVRIIIGILTSLVVAVFLAGWTAFAAVREEGREAGRTAAQVETAGVREEQKQLRYVVEELRGDVKEVRSENRDTRQEVKELRGDLRRLFPKLPTQE